MRYSTKYSGRANAIILAAFGMCFALNQLFLKSHFPGNSFLSNWLNDLLVMPIIFSFSALARLLSRAPLVFNQLYYSAMLIFCSIIFELARPIIVKESVADWLDVIAYTAGTAIYLLCT
jgi:hypothetical protein